MENKKHSIGKYIGATAFVTSLAFTPVVAGSVFAHGAAPDNGNTGNEEVVVPTVTVSSGLISAGDRGEAVSDVQSVLNNNGYDLNVDGIFGPITNDAVRDFQQDNDLLVDGIVGPHTKKALNTSDHTNEQGITITEAPEQKTESEVVDTPADSQSDIVSIAESLVGTPYTFGGTTPQEGFDSSGFINYVFEQVGIPLDRTHAEMWENNGTHVDSPSPGDVVFFEDTYKDGISHSGIYIGNNKMIHAGTEETGVEVTSLDADYWQSRYVGAKSFQ
ncbi:cell wall-binding protein [Virgibacillus phasianinus]|uniref:Cell wall-binding protein n=1 Tax=Virgibacillus phasianinus TaxID=2017483 RepID=A0A220U2T1_9BACI|nr:NlpC/P60 family protein [Virgibacillus phasianinus]ASK62400.1 cell wall-binding protein [Virgibacillus phasianinus]